MPLDVRLGKQVVSWGESTFILGGVNQINPIDVSSFRRPGAEIKEGLIPVNMAYASLGMTENLSAEAFYQLDFKETVTAGCGTFFSTNDYQPDGCNLVKTAAGNVSRDTEGNQRPDSDGQFGVAFRYFSESLDTEFGFYAMNIHGRLPLISGRKAVFNEQFLYTAGALDAGIQGQADALVAGSATLASFGINDHATLVANEAGLRALVDSGTATAEQTGQSAALTGALSDVNAGAAVSVIANQTTNDANPLLGITPMTYLVQYEEDQQLAGISFASNFGGVAVSGEVTHKLDVPFQINSTRLIGAALQADALYTYVYNAYGAAANEVAANTAGRAAVLAEHTSFGLEVLDLADGEVAGGYKNFDVTQAQVTGIQLIDQVLGASRIAIIAEAGYTYVHEFNSDIEFDGNGDYKDIVTESSWGYRARIVGQYNDVFSGVNLSPVLSWSHDVDGVAPAPGGNFIEGEKVLGFSLNAEYQNMYTAGISYTQYSGGETNVVGDRDFASISVGMQF